MKIIKVNIKTEQEIDLGSGYTEEDIKDIVKGYTFNGMFYERKNSNWIYIVEQGVQRNEKIQNGRRRKNRGNDC